MSKEIIALCRAMGAAGDQEALLSVLVKAVQEQLAGWLREGVEPKDCGSAFPLAAAMMTMERLSAMTSGGDEVTSFTAGDLTIRREAGGQSKNLSRRARELLAPWLENTGFSFRGVSG